MGSKRMSLPPCRSSSCLHLQRILVRPPSVATPPTRTPSSIVTLLQMCRSGWEVKQIHAQLVVSGFIDHPLPARRLLESYVNTSHIDGAWLTFERLPFPDVFVYNTMMRGLTLSSLPYHSLLLYNELLLLGCLVPDNYTYTFVLKACSHLKALTEGKQVHGRIIKLGIIPDTHVHSSLMHMYSSCTSVDDAEHVLREFTEETTLAKNAMITGYFNEGQVDKARAMFDCMGAKDVASWSAMATGYTQNGMYLEALALFRDMTISGVLPNESTLVSLLSACAKLGAIHQGTYIHRYLDKVGIRKTKTLSTALINMYAKCGSIESGYELFRSASHKDIVMWGAMISSFAIHGQATKCFKLFDEMVADGIYPNEFIFTALLSACSHTGHVKEGRQYFDQMVRHFGIQPSIQHYGCMVDLFGRAGRLEEAKEFILSMPEEPNSVIWGSLLSACRIHKETRIGIRAFRNLVKLEPMSGDRYKLIGLLFAEAGKIEGANMIRKIINKNKMESTCGSSLIEVDGTVYKFVVGDIMHRKAEEIYETWNGINRLIEEDVALEDYDCL